MSNAGHPPPLWYSTVRGVWSWLEADCDAQPKRLMDLSLGLLDDGAYDAFAFKSKPGDLFVLYSDGISEALDPAGNELGRSGLMRLVQSLDRSCAERFGVQFVSALDRFRHGAEQLDDETIIVVRRNDVHMARKIFHGPSERLSGAEAMRRG